MTTTTTANSLQAEARTALASGDRTKLHAVSEKAEDIQLQYVELEARCYANGIDMFVDPVDEYDAELDNVSEAVADATEAALWAGDKYGFDSVEYDEAQWSAIRHMDAWIG